MNAGHWFCSCCRDVVFTPAPGTLDSRNGVYCPVCHNNSMDWIACKPRQTKLDSVSPELAAALFSEMRKTITVEDDL